MKKSIDNQRKSKDIPTVSREFFIAQYAKVLGESYPRMIFTSGNAEQLIEDVILGRQGPSDILKRLAKKHGARPGRVGNFLRGLR